MRWADLSADGARLVVEHTAAGANLAIEGIGDRRVPRAVRELGFTQVHPGRYVRTELSLALSSLRGIFPGAVERDLPEAAILRDRDTLRELRASLRKAMGPDADAAGWRLARPDAYAGIKARALAQLLDVEPVFIRYEGSDDRMNFSGALTRTRGDRRIYVNVATEFPVLAVLGHEALHQMRFQQPDLYRDLVDALRPAIDEKAFARYYRNLHRQTELEGQALPDDEIREEAVADLVGDLLLDPQVWASIEDRDLVARLMQWLQELLASLVELFRRSPPPQQATLGGRELIADLDAARAAVGHALQRWQERGRRDALASDLQLAFRTAGGRAERGPDTALLANSAVRNPDGSLRVVYRGQYGPTDEPNAQHTRLPSVPYTVSPDVASVYAAGNDGFTAIPRVSACYLDLRNPMQLGDLEDPMITFAQFEAAITANGRVSPAEAREAFAGIAGYLRHHPPAFDYDRDDPDDGVVDPADLVPHDYTDCYSVADDARCVELAQRAGYDGFVFQGIFTSEDQFDRPKDVVEAAGFEFCGGMALEYRTFHPDQAVSIFDMRVDPVLAGVAFRRVFHGSPYRFDKPSLGFNRSGEGANTFGYGLYLAEARDVAEFYRSKLAARTHPVRWGNVLVPGEEIRPLAERDLGAGAGEEAVWLLHMLASGYRVEDMQRMGEGMDEPRRGHVLGALSRIERFHAQDVKAAGVYIAHEQGADAMLAKGWSQGLYAARRDLAHYLNQGRSLDQARAEVAAEQAERLANLQAYLADDEARIAAARAADDAPALDAAMSSARDTRWFIREAEAVCQILADPQTVLADTRHLQAEGVIYEADVADEARLLQWDEKVTAEQFGEILAHLPGPQAEALSREWNAYGGTYQQLGRDLYRALEGAVGGDALASQVLGQVGYSGLRYLDGQSRTSADGGSYNFVIWDLGALKSFEPAPAMAFKRGGAAAAAEPVFYSALLRAIEQTGGAPRQASAQQWLGWLDGAQRRGLCKATERAWVGVDAWLQAQSGAVTREALADHVREHVPKLREQVMGQMDIANAALEESGWEVRVNGSYVSIVGPNGDLCDFSAVPPHVREAMNASWKAGEGAAHYPGHQLKHADPVAEASYRELLLVLDAPMTPEHRVARDAMREAKACLDSAPQDRIEAAVGRFHATASVEQAHRDTVAELGYKTTHFKGKQNVLVHARFSERTDEHGLRTLLIEEIQSDWAQAGRQHGYLSHESAAQRLLLRLERAALQAELCDLPRDGEEQAARRLEIHERVHMIESQLAEPVAVAPTPFKRSEDWSMLVFRRLVRWAADAGYQQVAWTTGDTQIQRYSSALRQHVEAIDWVNAGPQTSVAAIKDGKIVYNAKVDAAGIVTYSPERRSIGLPASKVFGKDVADQILAKSSGRIQGQNLAVGGTGMRGFYDDILPAAVGRWARPLGGAVDSTSIETPTGDESSLVLLLPDEIDDLAKFDCFRTQDGREVDYYQAQSLLQEGRSLFVGKDAPMTTVHALQITPAMRDAVAAGMPMFRRGLKPDGPRAEEEVEVRLAASF
ncbi:hypothetical protein [Pseudoxanthomonas kaohsiungensis]|uniref:Large polyvalent protein associated domain-containing protein n=1 Tax=Pseudoxanthomonas kaohsiungensis TaxID=283923 RepID=A0ABW3LXL5_9GAMM|nr:hypothetical protein [Pseudoxanthomonas kaohsiungensis]